MSVAWIFNQKNKNIARAKISNQQLSISNKVLCLRNPWVTDSVFMGKLYTAMTVVLILFIYPDAIFETTNTYPHGDYTFTIMLLSTPLLFTPFLAYRILYIKKLSSIYLNRSTQKLYYQRFSKSFSFDWAAFEGGILKRTEFGGSSFSTNYALAFAPRRSDGTIHQRDSFWIESNEPTESDNKYVAEVWAYLCHFMDHGPDKLPPPGEPNWWYRPLHAICLTPAEAWRHYAPWRTGEPGEMQGKKLWQLPFWAVLFPYNLSLAICWYGVCRLFNVRAAPPPPGAFEVSDEKSTK
ncbi:DUF6708 domain-containing protein [Pseudomonas sp. Teo4]|uniref:DUF6708 domain-containing protein n=1 Tax=Pseudomonas sp. Teo4 TaxID=3064528 RepID=UPI002ABCE209|nr:DUF6708 domain-containing protein [Pseudomonas sp. Teo4]MDZ3992509.1 hypothetical protein [Pseudomonas sp. Teo4]